MRHLRSLEKAVTGFYGLAASALPDGVAPPPLFHYLLLTYRCNLACPYCYQKLRPRGGEEAFLEPARIESLLGQIPRFSLVSFSGGEPFCHPRAMEIVERAARTHRVSLVTNGTLLDGRSLERLVRLGPARLGGPGLTVIGISMQERNGRGSYAQGLARKTRLLEELRKQRVTRGKRLPIVDLKVVVREETLEDLPGLLAMAAEGLADTVTFQLQNDLVYNAYYDGQPRSVADRGDPLASRIGGPADVVSSRALLERQLDRIFSSPLRVRGRVRFYPELGRAETLSYLTGKGLGAGYTCVFPWSGVMISPLGNAFLCRNPEPESMSGQSLRRAWNSRNFRDFRRLVLREDVARKCAGCCFLVRARASSLLPWR